jgi:hypothetical protein
MLHESLSSRYNAAALVAAVVALSAVSAGALGAYPERPIRWIVPAAAGGGADASARVIAVELGTILGQQVVIDNRPVRAASSESISSRKHRRTATRSARATSPTSR